MTLDRQYACLSFGSGNLVSCTGALSIESQHCTRSDTELLSTKTLNCLNNETRLGSISRSRISQRKKKW